MPVTPRPRECPTLPHALLSLYIGRDHVPDQPMPTGPDLPDLQQALVRHIVEEQGLDRNYFANEDQLVRAVLKQDWPKKLGFKPIVLPYPSLGSLFKGREDFLTQLHESLIRTSGGRTAIISKALYGLGGIGKTRAAVEYAWAHEGDYTALLFVIAEAPEALDRNIAALTGPLMLPEFHTAEQEVRMQAVLDWLNTNAGWLLILDNVDTPEALGAAGALMGRITGGHVVMTSRLS